MATKTKTKKKQVDTEQLNLIEWCDYMTEQGHELTLHWDGGNDSGWVFFQVDGKEANSSEYHQIDDLIDYMNDHLDYGSWAGDFHASGHATYDSKRKAFVGEDCYSESDSEMEKCELKIKVPKHLWFDALHIQIEDESVWVTATFNIRNGFLTQEHEDFLEEFKNDFRDDVQDVIDKFCSRPETPEFRSMWEDFNLKYNDFKEEGKFMVYTINEISIGTEKTDEKDIYLDLKNFTNEEDEEDDNE